MSKSLEDLRNDYIKELEKLDEKIIVYRCRLHRAMTNRIRNADEIFTCRRLLSVFENERSELISSIRELQKYCEEK